CGRARSLMRRIALVLLGACASKPAPAPPPPPPPPPVVVEAVDAGPPAPLSWPGKVESMVPTALVTDRLYQTRTHVLWEESIEQTDTKAIEAIVALDKKTLKQRTVHSRAMPIPQSRQEMFQQSERFRRIIYTDDDALYIESSSDTLRITLDDKAP